MAEFVYGGDPLLNGKSDAGGITVPSNQAVVAAEWNTSQQHDDDLRTAIKTGTYHGLSQSSESVAAENKVKMRLGAAASGQVANTLQASVNGGIYKSMVQDGIHVRDYGAVGDGATDDAAAIQAAIEAACTAGKALLFYSLTCFVNSELGVKILNITIRGQGKERTILKTRAPFCSVLRLCVDP